MSQELRPEPMEADPGSLTNSSDSPTRIGPSPDDITRVGNLEALAVLSMQQADGGDHNRLDMLATCCRAKGSDDFTRRLRREAADAERGASIFAIALVDLHLECDSGCRFATAAAALTGALRDRDTRHQIGDKIAIILPGLTEQGCAELVTKLRSVLSDHDIDASVGGAAWQTGDTPQSLAQRAGAGLGPQ